MESHKSWLNFFRIVLLEVESLVNWVGKTTIHNEIKVNQIRLFFVLYFFAGVVNNSFKSY